MRLPRFIPKTVFQVIALLLLVTWPVLCPYGLSATADCITILGRSVKAAHRP